MTKTRATHPATGATARPQGAKTGVLPVRELEHGGGNVGSGGARTGAGKYPERIDNGYLIDNTIGEE